MLHWPNATHLRQPRRACRELPRASELAGTPARSVTPHGGADRAEAAAPVQRRARGGSAELVYHRVRELIVWGRLAPGSRIIETDIAARLDISRTPIRTALHRLQQEGYIVSTGGRKERRLIIAPLTQSDARELFEMVGAVESLAAGRAARASPEEREALGDELVALNAELVAATHESAAARVFDADMNLHRRIVEAGAGPRLRALHEAIKPQTERYIHLYTSSLPGEIARSVEEHELVIERITMGAADGARRAVQHHWRNAAARLERIIEVMGERGSW